MPVVAGESIVQNFTRFRGSDGSLGPVGTFGFDAEATGDTSGGTVKVQGTLTQPDDLGFKAVLYVSRLSTFVAGAGGDALYAINAANERVAAAVFEIQVPVAHGSNEYTQADRPVGILLSTADFSGTEVALLQVTFETNTNTVGYHLHGTGFVFDEEELLRQTRRDPRARWDASVLM